MSKKDKMIFMDYEIDRVIGANADLRQTIIKSNNALISEIKELKEITKQEIQSRDRVDISLEEYNSMRKEIAELREDRDRLLEVVKFIKLKDVRTLVPDSIRQYEQHNLDSLQTEHHILYKTFM